MNQNVTEAQKERIMDKQLAAIYGTGQEVEEETDLEKTAAAELLVKLAEEQGVDLDSFSDEEVGEMLGELYEGGVEHTAEADEETQEKYAEADYLGRIMAHSMVQELDNIEKEAGGKYTKIEQLMNAAKGSKVGKFLKGRPAAYREAGSRAKQAITGKDAWGVNVQGARGTRARQALKAVAPELGVAGGLAAAGTGAAIAKSKMKKKCKKCTKNT